MVYQVYHQKKNHVNRYEKYMNSAGTYKTFNDVKSGKRYFFNDRLMFCTIYGVFLIDDAIFGLKRLSRSSYILTSIDRVKKIF